MVKKFKITSVEHNKLPTLEESYELLDMIHKKVKPSLSSIKREIYKPLILYGAGNLGKMAKEYFDILNIPILLVIDKNPQNYTEDKFWNKIKIFGIKDNTIQINKEKCLLVICIVTSSYKEISSQLKSEGWTDIVPFYDITLVYQNKHPLNNGWCTSLLDKEDIKGMEYVLSNLQDNISYAHYLQFIAWHSLREEWIFKDAPISHKEKYFIPEIVSLLTDNETFVNVGAYDGEFTNKFMKNVNNKFNTIYAFEPDSKNVNRFLNNVDMNFNIHLIPKVLGNTTGKKKFYSNLNCLSQLSEFGKKEIEVHRLDDFKLSPTIVKIHVEGLESDIFDGGLETIKKNRSIVMMTIYHNRNGLWKVPLKIMNSLDNYIYYFRLHLWYGTCGIIYAIPKERLK